MNISGLIYTRLAIAVKVFVKNP